MTDQIFHNAKKLHWNKPNNELTRDFANFKHIISATKINKLKQQQKKTPTQARTKTNECLGSVAAEKSTIINRTKQIKMFS